jgi:primosomal protein N' (replication factor Y)
VVRVVRVVTDVSGVTKEFDYAVPEQLAPRVVVGTQVRVPLQGRKVAGWVVADDVEPPPGVRLLPLAAVRGLGPDAELVSVARWAAWRWAGRLGTFLATASPPVLVRSRPPAPPAVLGEAPPAGWATDAATSLLLAPSARAVIRLPPATSAWPVVAAAASLVSRGRSVLVLAPAVSVADRVARRLRAAGWPVALLPEQWAAASAGGHVVVGARAAAWAPAPDLGAVVVLDGHDQAYKEERAPTWSAWEVVAERAGRAGAPCLITSSCPTLDLLDWGQLITGSRPDERSGWPPVEVIDRRASDPRSGMISERVVSILRSEEIAPERPIVCVLNRRGRARLLACHACGELARCETCGTALVQPRGRGAQTAHRAGGAGAGGGGAGGSEVLLCPRCGVTRPSVCASCGSTRMSNLRAGVTRLVEEIEALCGCPVAEVSADADDVPAGATVLVGTEAVLHRVERASTVVFLEIDQELAAPRFRASEDALALVARAARLVGGRRGRVVLQTRLVDHPVIDAAVHADPSRLATFERPRREALQLPPVTAMAVLSGEGAQAFATALRAQADPALRAQASPVEIAGPLADGQFWVRAKDHVALCDALASANRPAGRLRVEVDPLRA